MGQARLGISERLLPVKEGAGRGMPLTMTNQMSMVETTECTTNRVVVYAHAEAYACHSTEVCVREGAC